jgi:hypothetical protein
MEIYYKGALVAQAGSFASAVITNFPMGMPLVGINFYPKNEAERASYEFNFVLNP